MALRYDDIDQLPPALRAQLMKQRAVPKRAAPAGQDRSGKEGGKYGNRKTAAEGISFDSQKEASRFRALKALEDMGLIWDLRLQVDFTLQEAYTTSDGERVRATRYRADFTYYTLEDGQQVYVVEDVKSKATRTRVYLDKRKRMLDKFGIRIREV